MWRHGTPCLLAAKSQCQRNQGTGLLGKAGKVRHAGTARTPLPIACQDSEQWRAGADAGRWLVVFSLWLLLAVAAVVWRSKPGHHRVVQAHTCSASMGLLEDKIQRRV